MKKRILLLTVLSVFVCSGLMSQSIGFSYFFPKNGHFSNPIAPVSLSLPLKFNNYFQITPGIVMNNIGGMSMTGFPDNYDSQRPLIGPFQSFETTLLPTISIPTKNVKVDIMGGIFGVATFNTRILSGNFNDMIREAYEYQVVNSDMSINKSAMGWGYIGGIRFNFKVASSAWAYIGANYYFGGQNMPLKGSYSAYGSNGIENVTVEYKDSRLLYEGFAISLGVSLN